MGYFPFHLHCHWDSYTRQITIFVEFYLGSVNADEVASITRESLVCLQLEGVALMHIF